MSLLRELDVCANVRRQGDRLSNGVERIGSTVGLVCEGMGLVRSIRATPDCAHRFGDDVAARLWHALLAQNIVTVPAAHDPMSVRLLPPLNVTASEIDVFLAAFDHALQGLTIGQEAR